MRDNRGRPERRDRKGRAETGEVESRGRALGGPGVGDTSRADEAGVEAEVVADRAEEGSADVTTLRMRGARLK